MKKDNSTIVEIKDKEVEITTNVKSNLDNLKEAIIWQIERVGCYIYDTEPCQLHQILTKKLPLI